MGVVCFGREGLEKYAAADEVDVELAHQDGLFGMLVKYYLDLCDRNGE